jgi:hypothetical protein
MFLVYTFFKKTPQKGKEDVRSQWPPSLQNYISKKFLHYIHSYPGQMAHISILLHPTVFFMKFQIRAELHEYRFICFLLGYSSKWIILYFLFHSNILLGWCISSCGFCLRRIFPNKNCMLAMYNTPLYSFRFPLSNFFGIFRFELMVRNFQDQNYGVSS